MACRSQAAIVTRIDRLRFTQVQATTLPLPPGRPVSVRGIRWANGRHANLMQKTPAASGFRVHGLACSLLLVKQSNPALQTRASNVGRLFLDNGVLYQAAVSNCGRGAQNDWLAMSNPITHRPGPCPNDCFPPCMAGLPACARRLAHGHAAGTRQRRTRC